MEVSNRGDQDGTQTPIAALWLIVTALCAGGALAQVRAPVDEVERQDIVATTVRSLGHPCDQPERACRRGGILADQAASILPAATPLLGRYDNDEPAEISSSIERRLAVVVAGVASARTSSPRPLRQAK